MNQLEHRLASLRQRFRRVVTLRGMAWVGAILLAGVLGCGIIDWRLHLPSLVRAFLLISVLSAAGWMACRFLLHPLSSRTDDLSLALRVEAHYPVLNDALASAVQFLAGSARKEECDSAGLRREAVRRALNLSRNYDFNVVVDERGIRMAALSLSGAAGLALILVLASPPLAHTGLARFAQPFADHDWPHQTALEIDAKNRIARGAAFEIQVKVNGLIPERALVEYVFENATPVEQVYDIARSPSADACTFVARLEGGRVQGPFRFQVRANDALSRWQEVDVLVPPQIVALHGRASPQIHLRFPTYTDLPEQDLPDGSSLIEAVAGTQIWLRAATDRPIAKSWLEFPPETIPRVSLAAHLNALGLSQFNATVSLACAVSRAWMHIPALLEESGCELRLNFVAETTGTFTLHFEDELGLGTTRLLELRTLIDPAPTVQLERPAPSFDSLNVLPDAEVVLRVSASDPVFALRTVYLKYRSSAGPGRGTPEEGSLALYDHESSGRAISKLTAALAGLPDTRGPLRLRPKHLDIERQWSLGSLHLNEGDLLVLQAGATDFDDLTVGKPPGRSHEIELQIVGRTALEIALNRAEAQVGQELARLGKQQQEALSKVIPIEKQWRADPAKLNARHQEDLFQAEQLQQQIRQRVGNRDEGVRADVGRILQTLRNNHLPRSGTGERMRAVAAELDRLRRAELEQIEPRLTEARKQSEMGDAKRLKAESQPGPLTQARKHQEEVAKTLGELLKLLEPWNSAHEALSEAKSLLLEQQELERQTDHLSKETPAGQALNRLEPEQRNQLERMADLQSKLAERAARLLQKMENTAIERKDQDPQFSQALMQAAELGKKLNTTLKMQEAEGGLRANQLAHAKAMQRESAEALRQITGAMEESPEAELDRLIKKMKDAEGRLADLANRQERLQKKAKAAQDRSDAAALQEELKRLAREQEELQREVQETVRELSRLHAERAGQALSQAGSRMEQALKRLAQGEAADEQQEEALDRINEARAELQQAREQAEEELAREKLAKLTNQLKGLKTRQDALRVEENRIHKQVLERRQWTRALSSSWRNLTDAQRGLGEETRHLAQEKLASAKVLLHLLIKSADAMTGVSQRMQARLDEARKRRNETPQDRDVSFDLSAESSADREIGELQQAAGRRLDQLLDALKAQAGMSPMPGQSGGGGNGGSGKSGPATGLEAYPPAAELKALRALQQEINDRTRSLGHRPPSKETPSPKDKKELESLQQEQHELADLYQELIMATGSEANKQ